jgi:hypothetical protein
VKQQGHDPVTVNIGISTVLARAGGTTRMAEILRLAADSALHRAIHRIAPPPSVPMLSGRP